MLRRMFPPFWLLLTILLMTALHFAAPVCQIIPMPINLSGSAMIVIGLLLFGSAVRMIVLARTTIKPFQESSALITTGPFRWSRNPIYLGMVLLLLGIAVLFGSLTPFPVVALFAFLIDRVFIKGEEQMLHATFTGEYADYCRRVRRWI